jgi:hypothetical protein
MLERVAQLSRRYAAPGALVMALAVVTVLALNLVGAFQDLEQLRRQEVSDQLAILGLQNRLVELAVAGSEPAGDAASRRAAFARFIQQTTLIDRGFAAILGSDAWLEPERELLRAAQREWADAQGLMSARAGALALGGVSLPPSGSAQAREPLRRAAAVLESLANSAPAYAVERRMTLLERVTVAASAFTALLIGSLVSAGMVGMVRHPQPKLAGASGSVLHRPPGKPAEPGIGQDFGQAAAGPEAGLLVGSPTRGPSPPPAATPRVLRGDEFLAQLEGDLTPDNGLGPLSVIVLQIGLVDGPDGAGKTAGTEALASAVGEVVAREILPSDRLADLGDGRFGVILYDTSRGVALAVSEQLRKVLGSRLGRADADSEVAIDVGVATCPEDGVSGAELIGVATEALPPVHDRASRGATLAVSTTDESPPGAQAASGGEKTAMEGPPAGWAVVPADAEAPGPLSAQTLPPRETLSPGAVPPAPTGHLSREPGIVFGRFLVRRGLLGERELSEAVRIQTEVNRHYGITALEAGLIGLDDFRRGLAYQRDHGVTFRTALLALHLATEQSIGAFDAAVRARRLRLGEILVRRGALSEQVVNQALGQFRGIAPK